MKSFLPTWNHGGHGGKQKAREGDGGNCYLDCYSNDCNDSLVVLFRSSSVSSVSSVVPCWIETSSCDQSRSRTWISRASSGSIDCLRKRSASGQTAATLGTMAVWLVWLLSK